MGQDPQKRRRRRVLKYAAVQTILARYLVTTHIADPRWANVGILRWANIGNVRWANVILLVGPSLAQYVDPTLGQRWQIIIQSWANFGKL